MEIVIISCVILGAVLGHILTIKIQAVIALCTFLYLFFNKLERTVETPIFILVYTFFGSALLGNALYYIPHLISYHNWFLR